MSYLCAYCERGKVEQLPANCPSCGRYISRPVSSAEAEQVRQAVKSAQHANRIAALESKHGFFAFLKGVGLGAIVVKLVDWAWNAIKRLFGF